MTDEQEESPCCGLCGGAMTLRTSSKSGKQFWGCNKFPECKGLIDVETQASELPLATTTFDDFRNHAALELFKTLLAHPENRQRLWDRYIVDRSEARLAVDLADDLVRELQK